MRSKFGTTILAISATTVFVSSCGEYSVDTATRGAPGLSARKASASGSGGISGASAPSTENLTTVRSAVSGTAIQYNFLSSQSPDPNATDTKDMSMLSVIQTTSTLAKDASGIAKFVKDFNKDASLGLAVGGLNLGIDTTITLLTFLGILPKPPDEVATLTTEVTQIGNGITWQALEAYIDMNYAAIENAALIQVPEYGTSYNAAGRPGDSDAATALLALYEDAAWQRAAVGSGKDSSTDQAVTLPVPGLDGAGAGSGSNPPTNWKQVVKAPTIPPDGLVTEWRLAAPLVLKAIALRLATLSAEDPNFPVDHSFDSEIALMRSNLKARYQTMLTGLQCGSKTYGYRYYGIDPSSGLQACAIVCADTYTGMSAASAITPTGTAGGNEASCESNQYTEGFADLMNYTAQSIRTRMPLFEMQSMIDLLYTFLHPGPDLTQNLHRISPQSQPNLCVGTVGESGAWGTNLQLSTCNAADPSQFWVYNRTTGQITNPKLGVCLDERWGYSYGTAIGVWGCDTPHPDAGNPQGPPDEIDNLAQKWTYDPESGQLRNAIGVAMAWLVNPVFPEPAQPGNSIVTEVVAQGAGFLTPQLDGSSTGVNMGWRSGAPTKGDGNGDGLADIRLTGAAWGNIPVAKNRGGGIFNGEAWPIDNSDFTNYWATSPNVKVLAGDFDGDGRADVALTGVSGWGTIPVAFATSNGSFRVTNNSPDWTDFTTWAAAPGVSAVTGDFDGDGRTDIALVGGDGSFSIPVAFSNGDGSFHVTDQPVYYTFLSYPVQPGARPVAGDFNGDGLSDIAIVGGTTANEIAVALSAGDGNGNFYIQIEAVTAGDTNFAYYSTLPGVQAVSGDFNGDGLGDIALTGGSGWWTIPVAFSTNGTFSVTNNVIVSGDGGFPTYASWGGVKAVAGDFNNDGNADIALTGGSDWLSIPVAYSVGDGTWGVTNNVTQGTSFPAQAATSGVSAMGGAY